MMNTGHPLHTFDLDKICNKKINIRYAKKNEEIELLDNSKYQLDTINLVIADDVKPVAIAGVMGDNKTGISDNTKDILIESAYFLNGDIFQPIILHQSVGFTRSGDFTWRVSDCEELVGVTQRR